MTTTMLAAQESVTSTPGHRPRLDNKPSPVIVVVFVVLLLGGLIYTALSLRSDVATVIYTHSLSPDFVAIVLSGSLYWLFRHLF